MKKIFIAAFAAAALTVPNAYAQSLSASLNENEILINQANGMNDTMIAVCYDKDGKLIYGARINASKGMYSFTLPDASESVRLVDIGNTSYDITFSEPTAAPAVTEEPTATPKATLNPAYEKEVDASNAFAVVEKVVTTTNVNNEEVYAITALCQEKEITVEVALDTKIKSAPGAFNELEGEDASLLQKGDAIYFEVNPSRTKVRGIYLIYRPTNIFEGTSFYNYFTDAGKAGGLWSVVPYGGKSPSDRYAYAFGIVADKYDDTLVLYSQSGLYDDSIEIDYTKDTVTYICDMEGKPQLEIASAAGIKKSKISKSDIDDEDNISFDDDQTYSIALVRLVDDTAADIVVYQNVEF